ncbi:hypothetical protein NW768_011129 [Fusarium equiseti]|uniref:DUF7908 domain-containing protein n=1 Tax=Fusarium equiseti TaxID=61235 RepID=A0ABQ8QYI8_FUSEQ|nr:hypothetical protein NW768_011129 [Fusarium equiseti]
MSPVRLFPFLLASLFGASIALQNDQIQPESWCITYLSTYLVPVSQGNTRPTTAFVEETIFPEVSEAPLTFSTDLAIPSTLSVPSTTNGIPIPEASGRSVIFRVVPESQDTKRDLQARAVGGFVGSQSEICAAASVFNLVQGRLLDGTLPIYWNGESFKDLRGNPRALPRGAITETFADDNGFLRFLNPALPNGQAGFCQDTESGQVYITFTASPPGCQTIRLSITEVDECRDGDVSSSTSSRTANLPLLSESTSVLLEPTSPSNAVPSTTTKDIQMGSSATDVPIFTSKVQPVFTSATLSETTTFMSDYTTEYTATTDATTIEDITTTTEDVPEPTVNLVSNGGFEDGDDGEWGVRTVEIVKDSRAKSGERMAFFKLNNQMAVGGNQLNQTIIYLQTANLYRLSFEGAVFGTYDFKVTTCSMEALVSGQIIKGWELKDFVVDRYQTYSVEFSPFYQNIELTLRLRCASTGTVTVTFGVDDVFLVDLGPKLELLEET